MEAAEHKRGTQNTSSPVDISAAMMTEWGGWLWLSLCGWLRKREPSENRVEEEAEKAEHRNYATSEMYIKNARGEGAMNGG